MDPNTKPTTEPRPSQPNEQPMTPMEAPQQPSTEYEKNVPHQGDQPVSRTGAGGEGSYEGTKQYDEGLDAFTKKHPVEKSLEEAGQINTMDPALKAAEQKGKAKAAGGSDRKPAMAPDQGRDSTPKRG